MAWRGPSVVAVPASPVFCTYRLSPASFSGSYPHQYSIDPFVRSSVAARAKVGRTERSDSLTPSR